ncbi:MAG: sigma-70 family RNA polymerase sigma factor [Candidatus Sulfotelmatobacter sp.]|jgi:RNA polymerase sigma-70 factor (ECF subfamily)
MSTYVAGAIDSRAPGAREIDQLLPHYLPLFYRTAFRHLGNQADAEDAVQDALLSACKHIGQFRGQARMSTWLTAIVINSARMHIRRKARRAHVSLEETFVGNDEEYPLHERLPDVRPTPEAEYRETELRQHAVRLMRHLSPPLRKTFKLRELDGLNVRETATILGIAEGTVKAQLTRARTKMKALMRKTSAARRRYIQAQNQGVPQILSQMG